MGADIDDTLHSLGSARLPLSLYALSVPGVAPDVLALAATRALGLVGAVGRLADGSVGFLYIGPHAAKASRQRALSERIAGALRTALAEGSARTTAWPVVLHAVHGWSDEFGGARTLIDGLLRLAPHNKRSAA